MYSLEETELPGIGRRFVVATDTGERLTIVAHDSGMVELYQDSGHDLQKAVRVATLKDEEARLVAAIIGRTMFRPESLERLSRHGIGITWVQLPPGSRAVGKAVWEALQRCGGTVTVLAVIEKDGKKHTNPGPDHVFQEGSQVALAGTGRDLQTVREFLEQGP